MAKDIEEFLRRAAERRRQKQSGQQPAQSTPPRQQPEPPQRTPLREQARREPARPQPQPVDAIIIDDEVEVVKPQRDIRRQSVQDHVASHINTSDIQSHATSLGKTISSVSGQVDARVHRNLDHDLTKLDDRPTVTDDPPPAMVGVPDGSLVKEILEGLKSPRAAGRSILIAEILKRPEWD